MDSAALSPLQPFKALHGFHLMPEGRVTQFFPTFSLTIFKLPGQTSCSGWLPPCRTQTQQLNECPSATAQLSPSTTRGPGQRQACKETVLLQHLKYQGFKALQVRKINVFVYFGWSITQPWQVPAHNVCSFYSLLPQSILQLYSLFAYFSSLAGSAPK